MQKRFKHDEKLKFSLPGLKTGYGETLRRFKKSKEKTNVSRYVPFLQNNK